MRNGTTAWLAGLFAVALLPAQEMADAPVNGEHSEAITIDLELESASFFTDLVVNARARFPEPVTAAPRRPGNDPDLAILGVELFEADSSTDAAAFAEIRLLPRQTGPVTIPAIEFSSETAIYRTRPRQIFVGAPAATGAMSFALSPAKTAVFTGEPLRIDVQWKVDFSADRVRSLRCDPEILSRPDTAVVVPRCTVPEEEQIGLPLGGRRILARRTRTENSEALGMITFPLFVRFTEPGKIELPPARLEIAHLQGKGGPFAPYAAFFNNGLFEPLTELSPFDRYFVEAPPISLTVLPLPEEGRTEYFSGLFAPCSIEAAIDRNQIEVGEIVEATLRVRSRHPQGLLDLPPLEVQRSLRGRFRAGTGYGRTWHEDGGGFLGRVRVLSADIVAFPSLRFQVFDPEAGVYTFLQTRALPLTVMPAEERRFFDMRSIAGETAITSRAEGIWHNAKPGKMREFLNLAVAFFAERMWLMLLLGPAAFFLVLPRVREARRRATDPVYRALAEAYEECRRLPEGGGKKWSAFRRFLAAGFSMPGTAWTPGDAGRLRATGVAEEDVRRIRDLHDRMDAANYSSRKPPCELPDIDDLARRLFDHFRKRLLFLLAGLFLLPGAAGATDWSEAEALFSKALAATPGEAETESLFTQAALRFEAAADSDQRRAGAAWRNAGNAWFQAGEIGRAIACYRQARIYRPFDDTLSDSLDAARGLCMDAVADRRGIDFGAIPLRWLAALLAPASWVFWAALLLYLRHRTSVTRGVVAASAAVLLGIAILAAISASRSDREGVLVAGSVYGRKGPAYQYEQAFHEPLHDGLEFRILEERDEWLLVALADRRQCWIPADQARKIRNRRR